MIKKQAKNIVGGDLACCCTSPITGFFRDGFCHTNAIDRESHVVCAVVTQAFLDFTASRGNDLSTPIPEYQFPGLQAGDKWCLCAYRWQEAYHAGAAPQVLAKATHEKAVEIIDKDTILTFCIDINS